MRRFVLVVLVLATLALGGAAIAQTTQPQPSTLPTLRTLVLPVGVELSDQELAEFEGKALKAYVGRAVIGFAGGFGGSAIGQYSMTGRVDWGTAVVHGLYGAGLGGVSRWLANRGWF